MTIDYFCRRFLKYFAGSICLLGMLVFPEGIILLPEGFGVVRQHFWKLMEKESCVLTIKYT